MSKAICRDEGQFTAKVSGAVPGAPFAVITTHFIFSASRKGGCSKTKRRKYVLAVNQMMYIREIISRDYTLGNCFALCPQFIKLRFLQRDYLLSHNASGSLV